MWLNRDMKTVLVLFVGGVMLLTSLVTPVWAANKGTDVDACLHQNKAWGNKLAAYERAKEIRKKAFEKTMARWKNVFDRLDEKKISTVAVRADAEEVKRKFDLLVAADDALLEARWGCGQKKNTQTVRQEARKAYVKAMRQLYQDLAKLRGAKTEK